MLAAMRRQRVAGVCATAALAALSGPARAADAPRPAVLALSWEAPAACLDAAALARLVERALARRVFVDAEAADARLLGTLTAHGRGFRAHLEVRRSGDDAAVLASRDLELDAAECHALDGSIAVVAALLADGTPSLPEAPLLPPTTLRVEVPPVSPAPSPPPSPSPSAPSQPPLPLRPTLGAFLGVGVGVTFGLLPGAAPWGGASAWIAPLSSLRLGLEGRAWAPSTRLVGGSGVTLSAFALAVVGCWRAIRGGVLALTACGRFDVGALIGEPIALVSSGDPRRALFLAGVDARAGLRGPGPLYFELAPEVGAPLTRPLYYYEDRFGRTHEVHRAAPVVFGLGISAGMRFGD